MKEMSDSGDTVIEEAHGVREAYAARFGYDLAALFRHARARAQQSDRGVAKRQPKLAEEAASAP